MSVALRNHAERVHKARNALQKNGRPVLQHVSIHGTHDHGSVDRSDENAVLVLHHARHLRLHQLLLQLHEMVAALHLVELQTNHLLRVGRHDDVLLADPPARDRVARRRFPQRDHALQRRQQDLVHRDLRIRVVEHATLQRALLVNELAGRDLELELVGHHHHVGLVRMRHDAQRVHSRPLQRRQREEIADLLPERLHGVVDGAGDSRPRGGHHGGLAAAVDGEIGGTARRRQRDHRDTLRERRHRLREPLGRDVGGSEGAEGHRVAT